MKAWLEVIIYKSAFFTVLLFVDFFSTLFVADVGDFKAEKTAGTEPFFFLNAELGYMLPFLPDLS